MPYSRDGRSEPTKQVIEDVRKNLNKAVDRGVEIVNIIERHYRWKLTVAEELDTSSIRGHVAAKVIFGSRNWFKSPHMTSLYTLFLRAAGHSAVVKSQSFEQFQALTADSSFEDIKKAIKSASANGGDFNRLYQVMSTWPVVFGRTKALFRKLPPKKNFSPSTYKNRDGYNQYGGEGIQKLSGGTSLNKDLQDRLRKLLAEERRKKAKGATK
jgi:hypothetical protein